MVTPDDIKNYLNALNSTVRGEMKEQSVLRVMSSMSDIYDKCGIQNKPIILPCGIVKKVNIKKHEVPLLVLEDLPLLLDKPIMVLKSKTEKASYVVVLDALDNNDNRIISIVRDNCGKCNRIPSIYGKNHFEEFVYDNIRSQNVLYYDKEKVVNIIRPSSLQLLGVYDQQP